MKREKSIIYILQLWVNSKFKKSAEFKLINCKAPPLIQYWIALCHCPHPRRKRLMEGGHPHVYYHNRLAVILSKYCRRSRPLPPFGTHPFIALYIIGNILIRPCVISEAASACVMARNRVRHFGTFPLFDLLSRSNGSYYRFVCEISLLIFVVGISDFCDISRVRYPHFRIYYLFDAGQMDRQRWAGVLYEIA